MAIRNSGSVQERMAGEEELRQPHKGRKKQEKNFSIKKAVGALVVITTFFTGKDNVVDAFQFLQRQISTVTAQQESLPDIEVSMGRRIIRGGEVYLPIIFLNADENMEVSSGSFKSEFFVGIKSEEEIVGKYHWTNMFYAQEIKYDDTLSGSILLLKKDYSECIEGSVRQWHDEEAGGGEVKISEESDDIEPYPYLCVYFEYQSSNGEESGGYYLLELEKDSCGKFIQIDDPANYYQAIEAKA